MKIITVENLKTFFNELNKKFSTKFYSKTESDNKYQSKGDYVTTGAANETYLRKNDNIVASKLATARDIKLTGDVKGTGTFDGSKALEIVTTLKKNMISEIVCEYMGNTTPQMTPLFKNVQSRNIYLKESYKNFDALLIAGSDRNRNNMEYQLIPAWLFTLKMEQTNAPSFKIFDESGCGYWYIKNKANGSTDTFLKLHSNSAIVAEIYGIKYPRK